MTNEELQKEMIAAMKAKDKVRLSIIRQVKAEVKNIEVNEQGCGFFLRECSVGCGNVVLSVQ